MKSRLKGVLLRQWILIQEISRHRRGCTVSALREVSGASTATLYRDIADLRSSGMPIDTQMQNGEARYTFCGEKLPPLTVSASQLAALRFARRALSHLDGAQLVKELDELLAPYRTLDSSTSSVSARRNRSSAPNIVLDLDRAIHQKRRTRIRVYTRNVKEPTWRVVDPLSLRSEGQLLYLVAYDNTRSDYRLFKVARISKVQKLTDKIEAHKEFEEDRFFANAVKVWSGDQIDARVRLQPSVAHLATEYALTEQQTVEAQADGSVIVCARVAGIPETLRWVLSWGRDAEALEPLALRDAVAEQVRDAAGRYAVAALPKVVRKRGNVRQVARASEADADAE
jgi:predicted DNA-binding transcriptional regulator YafY